MAQRHAAKGNAKHPPSKRANRGIIALIWGIILTVVAGGVIFATSSYHESVRQRVKYSQYPRSYSEYVEQSAKKYDLETALVYAVIRTESNFNPDAQSGAGAHGLMQITEDTFDHYMFLRGEEGKYTLDDLYDPAVNIDYGCNILRDHLDQFGDEECAVAAYNAGPGNVLEWLSDPSVSSDGKTLIVENIPFEETRNYVDRVESAKKTYIELYGSDA